MSDPSQNKQGYLPGTEDEIVYGLDVVSRALRGDLPVVWRINKDNILVVAFSYTGDHIHDREYVILIGTPKEDGTFVERYPADSFYGSLDRYELAVTCEWHWLQRKVSLSSSD